MSFAEIISRLANILRSVSLSDVVDIAIISVIIYYVLRKPGHISCCLACFCFS